MSAPGSARSKNPGGNTSVTDRRYVADDRAERDCDDAFLIWVHGGDYWVHVDLPDGLWADTYTVVAHSGRDGELPTEKLVSGSTLALPPRTVVVLAVD